MNKCTDSYKGIDKRKHLIVCFVLSIIIPIIALIVAIGRDGDDVINTVIDINSQIL